MKFLKFKILNIQSLTKTFKSHWPFSNTKFCRTEYWLETDHLTVLSYFGVLQMSEEVIKLGFATLSWEFSRCLN